MTDSRGKTDALGNSASHVNGGGLRREDAEAALFEARGGRDITSTPPIPEGDELFPKLWRTPCWFSYRLNYLAQKFNEPVYGRIQALHGLLRPEFVVLYSLFLRDGLALADIGANSAFPKNTLSRAAQKLQARGLIRRVGDTVDQRRALLFLTPLGRAIVAGEMEPMRQREEQLLATLSPAERLTLSDILLKLVVASRDLPGTLEIDTDETEVPEPSRAAG